MSSVIVSRPRRSPIRAMGEVSPSRTCVACELATAGFEPDLNVLLDVDPLTANSRRQGPTDAVEEAGEEFHRRVREAYLAVAAADEKRWIVIDGAHSADEVEAEVLRVVETRLGLKSA